MAPMSTLAQTPGAVLLLTYTPRAYPIACAWDLSVIAFERAAWVQHMLANPRGPDLEAYLVAQLDEAV